MADRYWIANLEANQLWTTATNWADNADGTGANTVPVANDNVHFGHATTLAAGKGFGSCELAGATATLAKFTSYEGYNAVQVLSTFSILATGYITPNPVNSVDLVEIGFKVGMVITVTGAANAGNNSTFEIASLVGNQIQVTSATGMVNETGSPPTLTITYEPVLDLKGQILNMTGTGGTLMTLNSKIANGTGTGAINLSGSYVGGQGNRYFLCGSNQAFDNRSSIIMTFTASGGAMNFDDGIYPIVQLAGANFSCGYVAPTSNKHGAVKFYRLKETVACTWDSGTGSIINRIKKRFEVDSTTSFILLTNLFNTDYSTWVFNCDNTFNLPVSGNYTNYASGFVAKWYNLIIKNTAASSAYKAVIGDRKNLQLNSLTIEEGAQVIGKIGSTITGGDGGSTTITCVTRPIIRGSWNFVQIADGIYSSVLTDAYPITPSHGIRGRIQFSDDGGAFFSHEKLNWDLDTDTLTTCGGAFMRSSFYEFCVTYPVGTGTGVGTTNRIWITNATPSVPYFTDNQGNHHNLLAGGGGTPSLTATHVGFGSASNLLTGSADLTFVDSGGIQTFQVSGSEPKLAVQDNTAGLSAARITLDPSVPDGTGGLAMFWGIASDPDLYMKIGAYAGANNFETMGRDFRIFSNTGNLMTMDESASNTGVGKTFGLANSSDTLPLPTRTLDVGDEDSSTNTVLNILGLTRQTTGTPAAGIGVGMDFVVETSANNNEIGATIEAVTTDVSSTSEDFDMTFKLMASGATAAEKMKIASTGAITFNNEYTFPTADGSSNQVLQTNGSGALSFATVSGGGGTDEKVKINALDGTAGYLENKIIAGTGLSSSLALAAPFGTQMTFHNDSRAFKTIAVAGQTDVVADLLDDTLTLVAGSNMTITTNAGTDTITFASSGGGGGAATEVVEFVNSNTTINMNTTIAVCASNTDCTAKAGVTGGAWAGMTDFGGEFEDYDFTATSSVFGAAQKGLVNVPVPTVGRKLTLVVPFTCDGRTLPQGISQISCTGQANAFIGHDLAGMVNGSNAGKATQGSNVLLPETYLFGIWNDARRSFNTNAYLGHHAITLVGVPAPTGSDAAMSITGGASFGDVMPHALWWVETNNEFLWDSVEREAPTGFFSDRGFGATAWGQLYVVC